MVRFGLNRVAGFMDRLGVEEDTPIENRLVTKQIEGAQAKAEGYNFDIRRHVVQYDDVMNRQREVIYAMRNKILSGEGTRERVLEMVNAEIGRLVSEYTADEEPSEWNLEGLLRAVHTIFPLPEDVQPTSLDGLDPDEIQDFLVQLNEEAYSAKEAEVSSDDMRLIERIVLLNTIDSQWIEYLTSMEELRQGIGLRAYGQRDPLVEYKSEAYSLFRGLVESIERESAMQIHHVSITRQAPPPLVPEMHTNREEAEPQSKTHRNQQKIGRNEPCPCGSGKKFKRCHGASAA